MKRLSRISYPFLQAAINHIQLRSNPSENNVFLSQSFSNSITFTYESIKWQKEGKTHLPIMCMQINGKYGLQCSSPNIYHDNISMKCHCHMSKPHHTTRHITGEGSNRGSLNQGKWQTQISKTINYTIPWHVGPCEDISHLENGPHWRLHWNGRVMWDPLTI